MLRRGLCIACILPVLVCMVVLTLPVERASAISGTTITEYTAGLAPGCEPADICAGPDGNLWFTDWGANMIGRITPAGVVTEYGTGLTAGCEPFFICAGPDGNLWFTEEGAGGRIGRITTAGVITDWPTPTVNSSPAGICAGPDGNLWFTEKDPTVAGKVGRITPAGIITEFDLPGSPANYPAGIAAGPDGNLWIAAGGGTPFPDRIFRVTTAGAVTGDFQAGLTDDSYPFDIVAGPDGAMWFTENSNGIGRITTAGVITEYTDGLTPDCEPAGITAGPDGALWFTEEDATYGNRIGRITTAGAITDWALPNADSQPYGICAGPDSAVWFAEWAGRVGRAAINGDPWYLAEGCTAGDFETWVLVQNANPAPVSVDLTLMTDSGKQNPPELQGVSIPANSRSSFNLGAYVQTYDVSTMVTPTGGDVICERAVYGGNRTWGTDSIGTTTPAGTWYLAEGCTASDFETWVLVQNPGGTAQTVSLTFMTSTGPQDGPQDVSIPAYSRTSFNVGDYVTDYNVSTFVTSSGGVVAERAMYGNGRQWAHDSIGVTTPDIVWYMAEGCTAGGFETWVLVQNPNPTEVTVNLTLMTESGPQNPPALQGVSIPANSRKSFNLGDYVTTYNVSTQVECTDGNVVCERAVYGGGRTWGTDSIGAPHVARTWYLAEGCTAGGFETWVLVQNPTGFSVEVDLTFMTSTGPQDGPQDVTIPAFSRQSFNVGDYVVDWNVSTQVNSTGQGAVCERAMYGNDRTWAHDSVGYPQ